MLTFTPEEAIPGRVEGQLEVDAWDGKVNRNSEVVKSVDRLAYSCREIDWCGRGSSCALEMRIEVEDKKFMRGSLDHDLCICIIFDIDFASPICLNNPTNLDQQSRYRGWIDDQGALPSVRLQIVVGALRTLTTFGLITCCPRAMPY